MEDLERQIHALEGRIDEIGAMLTDPRLYIDGDRVRAVSRERKEAEAADERTPARVGGCSPPRWPAMSEFYAPVDPDVLKRQRARARELRASPWWKRRISDRRLLLLPTAGGAGR